MRFAAADPVLYHPRLGMCSHVDLPALEAECNWWVAIIEYTHVECNIARGAAPSDSPAKASNVRF